MFDCSDLTDEQFERYTMNEQHDTSVSVSTYPDEFKPVLKLINHALINNEIMSYISDVEAHYIYGWLDEFQSKAANYSK